MSTILVIDDDPDTLKLLRLILQSAGHAIVLAENGQQGLDWLATGAGSRPDLILCDILMPVFDGYCVLLAIRADPDACEIPVLMLSALGQEKDKEAVLAAGADGYIGKPFAMRPLLAAIDDLLGRKQAGRPTG